MHPDKEWLYYVQDIVIFVHSLTMTVHHVGTQQCLFGLWALSTLMNVDLCQVLHIWSYDQIQAHLARFIQINL